MATPIKLLAIYFILACLINTECKSKTKGKTDSKSEPSSDQSSNNLSKGKIKNYSHGIPNHFQIIVSDPDHMRIISDQNQIYSVFQNKGWFSKTATLKRAEETIATVKSAGVMEYVFTPTLIITDSDGNFMAKIKKQFFKNLFNNQPEYRILTEENELIGLIKFDKRTTTYNFEGPSQESYGKMIFFQNWLVKQKRWNVEVGKKNLIDRRVIALFPMYITLITPPLSRNRRSKR